MNTGLVHRAVCLFTSQLLLVLTAPTHGGMARLSWPGWLVTYRDGLPACWRSNIQVLTGWQSNMSLLLGATWHFVKPQATIKISYHWYIDLRVGSIKLGMARLSWPGWLVTYRDGLPACWRSNIQVLTGLGVD